MTRSERRAQTVRIKAKARKKLAQYGAPTDAKTVGINAAQHNTCACRMCTSPEAKHRRPAGEIRDPEQEQDWVHERRCDFITGDAQVHQITPGQQP